MYTRFTFEISAAVSLLLLYVVVVVVGLLVGRIVLLGAREHSCIAFYSSNLLVTLCLSAQSYHAIMNVYRVLVRMYGYHTNDRFFRLFYASYCVCRIKWPSSKYSLSLHLDIKLTIHHYTHSIFALPRAPHSFHVCVCDGPTNGTQYGLYSSDRFVTSSSSSCVCERVQCGFLFAYELANDTTFFLWYLWLLSCP